MSLRTKRKQLVAMLPASMVCLALSIAWPHLVHANISANWTDAIRGVLCGISIGLTLLLIVFITRQSISGKV